MNSPLTIQIATVRPNAPHTSSCRVNDHVRLARPQSSDRPYLCASMRRGRTSYRQTASVHAPTTTPCKPALQALDFIHHSLTRVHPPHRASQKHQICSPQETPRPGLLHGLGWELCQKDAMALFYGHSVTRELVIWREPRYFQRIINSSHKKCREMKAGGWRTWMSRLGNFPRDGDFLIHV